MAKIKLTETQLNKIISESIKKALNELATDEQFDEFMKWAMTEGNELFDDAAYAYDYGDDRKLHDLAIKYSQQFGVDENTAFDMAKEAAEGIYQFIDTAFANPTPITMPKRIVS